MSPALYAEAWLSQHQGRIGGQFDAVTEIAGVDLPTPEIELYKMRTSTVRWVFKVSFPWFGDDCERKSCFFIALNQSSEYRHQAYVRNRQSLPYPARAAAAVVALAPTADLAGHTRMNASGDKSLCRLSVLRLGRFSSRFLSKTANRWQSCTVVLSRFFFFARNRVHSGERGHIKFLPRRAR